MCCSITFTSIQYTMLNLSYFVFNFKYRGVGASLKVSARFKVGRQKITNCSNKFYHLKWSKKIKSEEPGL